MTRRFQRGCIWRKKTRVNGRTEYGSTWYIRYTVDATVNGRTVRTQKNEVLCAVDREHSSATCKAVKDLAAAHMARVNAGVAVSTMRVADFWENVYIPWAKEINPKVNEPNLRQSTITGYEQVWSQHLKDHFADATLANYKTPTATAFLTEKAKTQGRNTVHHIRSLMSGVFSHAVATGYVPANPIKGAAALGKTARPAKTGHYSLREALSILAALSENVEAQLVMALSFFWGLRPSEIRGLKWEDFSYGDSSGCEVCKEGDWDIEVAHVHIRRGIDKAGNVTGLKTDESEQPLPLMVPIAMPLGLWREQSGNPSEGWVFQNKAGNAKDLRDVVRTVIRPAVIHSKNKWRGLYAGRRGAATMLLQLTGNALASQQLLRHKPGSVVTARHYLKAVPQALLEGTRLVEREVEKALAAGEGK